MILFISFLALTLCFLNYYFFYPINENLFYLYSFICVLIVCISISYVFIRNKNNKKNNMIIWDLEDYFNLPHSNSLQETKENLKKVFQTQQVQLQDQKTQKHFMQKQLHDLIQSLHYNKPLKHDKVLQNIFQEFNIIKKSQFNIYRNIHACIINDNSIENYLLQCILHDMGISSEIKTSEEIIYENYQFVISKNPVEHGLNYVFSQVDTKDLAEFLNTHFKQDFYQMPYMSNVLIFKSSSFENDLILNITNQFCQNNQAASNLSDFKSTLRFCFKLILLDYEVIKFDFDYMLHLLHEYKNKYPESRILLFSKERVKECNFADEILHDLNKNEWLNLLKKYL
ncbi:hypothetical protein [Campylobacter sp. 2014D-0216]|uniref:hypothetical protein n=1 Tax=Campylobacter sp. 2014D-0216 TaxID=1813595 RepID=UPI0018A65C5D|nr:hypothetical protein [Campylobacter sp. 2014D-0216]QOR01669.1 hypothetical protein A0083_02660 [Campylobacter sp. 2014D-0216]